MHVYKILIVYQNFINYNAFFILQYYCLNHSDSWSMICMYIIDDLCMWIFWVFCITESLESFESLIIYVYECSEYFVSLNYLNYLNYLNHWWFMCMNILSILCHWIIWIIDDLHVWMFWVFCAIELLRSFESLMNYVCECSEYSVSLNHLNH